MAARASDTGVAAAAAAAGTGCARRRRQCYAAAGVMPVSGDDVLLGSEPVVRQGRRAMWWGPFGGRREARDGNDPRRTAWREFYEETGGAFGGDPLLLPHDFDARCALCLYCERSRYVLYVVRTARLQCLPHFTDADAARDATLNKRELRWVRVADVVRAVRRRHGPASIPLRCGGGGGAGLLAPFIASLLRRHIDDVVRALDPSASLGDIDVPLGRAAATATTATTTTTTTTTTALPPRTMRARTQRPCPALESQYWPAPAPLSDVVRQQQYAASIVRDERFRDVAAALPASEVIALRAALVDRGATSAEPDATELRVMLVLNRLMNPICNECWDKSATARLRACAGCHMTFYCSQQCQRADWRKSHSKWCCVDDAAPDTGPLATAIAHGSPAPSTFPSPPPQPSPPPLLPQS